MGRVQIYRLTWGLLLAALLLAVAAPVRAEISFLDNAGQKVVLPQTPTRVVSLVPEVSEAIWALGAGQALKGTTIHSTPPAGNPRPVLVGGFYAPSLEAIKWLQPELVFVGGPHKELRQRLAELGIPAAHLQARRLPDLYRGLATLGQVFDRQPQAGRIAQKVWDQLALIAGKVALIPVGQRRRVLRIMSVNEQEGYLTVPGDDSFQNDLIRAAGGQPPALGRGGQITELGLAQWQKLDPQAVYVCGGKNKLTRFLSRPGWREAEAVRADRVFSFPCTLTCQVSVHTGYFVQWLSAWVYNDLFEQKAFQLRPWRVTGSRPLKLDLGYVHKAMVLSEEIQDFAHRTLLIQLKGPQQVLSTLEGQRAGLTAVGNHYFPPPAWRLGRHGGLASFQAWCDRVARELAGKHPLAPAVSLGHEDLPRPLALALAALLRGLASQPQPLIPISGSDCGQ